MSAPAFDPGAVHVSLRWSDGHVRDATVRVVRPNAAALLRGRKADEAVRMLPLLYAVCGAAQGFAARLALAAARGVPCEPCVDDQVLAEARREHLWRLLLDWPQALGSEGQQAVFVEARKRLQDGSYDVWAKEALVLQWERLEKELRAVDQPDAANDAMLPPTTAAESLAAWPRLDEAFAAAPTWNGKPASTGALARHPELASRGALAARVAARIADLTSPRGLGAASAAVVAPGVGRAAVETARGLLMHEIALDGDCVADCVIVAPTEWNFHSAGALGEMLAGLRGDLDQVRARASLAVLAFDPCVRSEVDLSA